MAKVSYINGEVHSINGMKAYSIQDEEYVSFSREEFLKLNKEGRLNFVEHISANGNKVIRMNLVEIEEIELQGL